MKKLMTFFALCACLFLAVSCSDDDEMEPMLDSNELAQTTWDFEIMIYGGNGTDVTSGVLFFSSEKRGNYVDSEHPDELIVFAYQVDNRLVTFDRGELSGTWTVIEKSKGRIVLRGYLPKESMLVLTRKY